MSQKGWSIKTAAQADPADAADADLGADVVDPEMDSNFPPDFGINVGTLLIFNHYENQAIGLATNYSMSPQQLQPVIDGIIQPYKMKLLTGDFTTILRQGGGNPDLLPDQGAISSIFQTLIESKEYDQNAVMAQQAIAMSFFPVPPLGSFTGGSGTHGQTAWATIGKQIDMAIKRAIQNVQKTVPVNQAVQQFAPQLAPYNASKRSRTIVAQAEQAQQGPLASGRYESMSQLRQDLITLGPKPETYEKIMSMVGPDAEDSVKEALGSFYQGMAASLSTIYDMLVGAGMANPIDAEIVEQLQSQHPELSPNAQKQDKPHVQKNQEEMAMASLQYNQKFAGLYLPVANSGMHTLNGNVSAVNSKTAATAGYPAYESHGPGENRFCPKIRKDVNTFICRNHCLDGLIVDDHQVLCGEAIWRQSVMDKFSVEYRDKDGNWKGGYLEKRFEIHHDDGGHPALLKPGQRNAPIHEDAWSLEKRMSEMRKSQGGSRGYNTPKDSEELYNFDQHDLMKGPKNPQIFEKKKDGIAKLAINVGDSLLEKTAQPNNLPPEQGGIDDFMSQQQSDELTPNDADMNAQNMVTIDGYAEQLDPQTGEWETVMVSKLSGLFKEIKQIDVGRMAIIDGDDGNTYAVTPQSIGKGQPPSGPSPDANAPWVTGASSNGFNLAAKKKKKPKSKGSWLPYHIWQQQQNSDADDNDDSDSLTTDSGDSGDSGGDGGSVTTSKKASADGKVNWSLYQLSSIEVDGDVSIPVVKASKWSINKEAKPAWGLEKKAWGLDMSNVGGGGHKDQAMGENINHGKVGKKCLACGKIMAGNSKQCDNPQCRSMNLGNYNQSDAESATGAINNAGMIPIAASDAVIHLANGVYKATKGNKSAYGENPEEALQKLAQGLAQLEPGTIDQESSEIVDARQDMLGMQENQPAMPNPIPAENAAPAAIDPTPTTEEVPPMDGSLPPEVVVDETPSTPGMPVEDTTAVPMEIGPNGDGQAISEFIPELSGSTDMGQPHISPEELDSHLATEHVSRHPNERVEIEEQAINSGAHPD